MKTVVMTGVGGTEVLQIVEREETGPGPGQVAIAVSASGVNFMDIGVRRGSAWSQMPLPRSLGVEGAGHVIAVGEGVADFRPGQRVAWVYIPGSYAESIVATADALVPVPDEIDDQTAAAVMMQGLTASHFATDFYPVQKGDTALVHAAAGGLGLLLTQIIKMRGGKVIGRVSTEDKAATAVSVGADHIIVDKDGKFVDGVMRFTNGEGVHIVYDGSGPKTFKGSLASLRRCGTFCWFGPVLGGPGPIDIMSLPKSIRIGYATFFDHIYTTELYRARTRRLFEWIARGDLRVTIGATYSLSDATLAHADMERRSTVGKLLLIP